MKSADKAFIQGYNAQAAAAYNLLPGLRAWQNAALPLVYAGVSTRERKRRATEALGKYRPDLAY